MNLISDYLARAKEARETAETITDPGARAEMLKIAEICERMAARHPAAEIKGEGRPGTAESF
jgi:hypothetical protein